MEINSINNKHKLFQQRLEQLADPLKNLYYKGNLSVCQNPSIAIVGSRKPTPYGQEMTRRLAYALAKEGITIVSGLALGVDGIAHQAAIDAGGTTVAVMAGGLDTIYPSRHRQLATRIIESGGALVSEYPTGIPCLPHQFVARNRIIASLAEGTLLTEAAVKSGSLHTAQFALELGRTVMAVPGLATNPMASGCLNLLRTGAVLVTCEEDIFFALGYNKISSPAQLSLLNGSPEELALLTLLAAGIQDGDELFKKSNLAVSQFNQTLSMLEITGRIKALGGNQWLLA